MIRKNDDELLDLFKGNLDNCEVIPSSSLFSSVMKKVKIKEFFSFTPSKFNVWYAAGIAAFVTGGIIVLSSLDKTDEEPVTEQPVSVVEIVEQPVSVPDQTSAIDITPFAAMREDEDAVDRSIKSASVADEIVVPKDNEDNEVSDRPTKVYLVPVEVKKMMANDIPTVAETRSNTMRSSLFTPSVNVGCAPLKVNFKINNPIEGTYMWSFGDGGVSTLKEPEWLFDEDGTFTVNLKIMDDVKVLAEYSSEITVYPRPVARFESRSVDAVLPDAEVSFLNYSTGAVLYEWSFGDGTGSDIYEPTHKYEKNDEYDVKLVAISEYGCIDSMEISDMFASSAYYIKFPNVFCPNAAGQSGGYYVDGGMEANEVFHPVSYGVASYQLRIYNRIGVLLFESNSLDVGWDGYYRNRLCDPGVYIWKVRVTYLNGKQDIQVGDVTILNDNVLVR